MSVAAQAESLKKRAISILELEGSVVKIRILVYPPIAGNMKAYVKAGVRIVISNERQVIEAMVISGHPTLRSEAEDAARERVYKPTTLCGIPMKVETI
jgi:Gram-negative bacterial TonB protein C-terminal